MKYKYTNRTEAPKNSSPLSEGVHTLTIDDGELRTSAAGNPMLEVTFKSEDGRFVWDYLTFTEKAVWKVDSFLRCFDMQPQEDEEIDFNEKFVDSLKGATGQVELAIREWEGKQKNDVRNYIAPAPAPASKTARSKVTA